MQAKNRRALHHAPAGLDARRIHHQGERRQHFGDPAAVKGRTDMNHVRRAKTIGFLHDPFYGWCSNQGFVLLNGMESKCRI